ncbi:hypothetical protein DFR24_2856 [Panacagrimonas perspica]|uniref:Uncharacterized protein n=1 Tax=Panacagrimonas perspica TaxID=381431 RepID=A0A4R7P3Z3_9GAMM|nr:hypothetical protein [Panacagrimonas perspica]TDU28484.1 hypothetical protein DFR24_2856 [Panacagrimonas perspica]THD00883.1 hypothetical protein B1810_22550 [Panacagrimonas perspica]
MPTIWIAVLLSACTFGGALAVIEVSGDFAQLAKGIYALAVLGIAAYLVTRDSPDTDDFASGALEPQSET